MTRFALAFGVFVVVAGIAIWLFIPHAATERKVDISTNKQYVAMGDSVAAGAGAGTVIGVPNACGVSDAAYPNTVAKSLGLSMTNISCGGASLPNGVLGLQAIDTNSQLNKLFTLPTPSIITLTIGANDAHWIQVLRKCFQQCADPSDKEAFDNDMKAILTNLKTFYDKLHQHYGSAVPHVFVTGYYAIFPTGVSSVGLRAAGLSANDASWIESLRNELNAIISTAGDSYDFVTFVPVDFSGHELFTDNSWVQGLQDPAPIHPNAAGYEAIGKTLVEAIKAHEKN